MSNKKLLFIVIFIEVILYLLDKLFNITTVINNLDIYILLIYFIYILFIFIVFERKKIYRFGITIIIVCILIGLYFRSLTDYYKFISPNKDVVIVSEYGDLANVYYDIYVERFFFFKKKLSEKNIFTNTMGSIFSSEDQFEIDWRDNKFIINCWTREFENDKEIWKEYTFKIK